MCAHAAKSVQQNARIKRYKTRPRFAGRPAQYRKSLAAASVFPPCAIGIGFSPSAEVFFCQALKRLKNEASALIGGNEVGCFPTDMLEL